MALHPHSESKTGDRFRAPLMGSSGQLYTCEYWRRAGTHRYRCLQMAFSTPLRRILIWFWLEDCLVAFNLWSVAIFYWKRRSTHPPRFFRREEYAKFVR